MWLTTPKPCCWFAVCFCARIRILRPHPESALDVGLIRFLWENGGNSRSTYSVGTESIVNAIDQLGMQWVPGAGGSNGLRRHEGKRGEDFGLADGEGEPVPGLISVLASHMEGIKERE